MGKKIKCSSQRELSHSKYCQWFSGAFKGRSNVKEALILIFFLVILASGSLFSVHLLRCIPCCFVASFLLAEKTIERPGLFCNDHDPTYKTDIACVCTEKPKFHSTTALTNILFALGNMFPCKRPTKLTYHFQRLWSRKTP